MRLCKCGCGGEINNGKWEYLRGHKKNGSAAERKAQQEGDEQVEEASRFELNLTMSVQQIEACWASLSPLQKANGLIAALQTEA